MMASSLIEAAGACAIPGSISIFFPAEPSLMQTVQILHLLTFFHHPIDKAIYMAYNP